MSERYPWWKNQEGYRLPHAPTLIVNLRKPTIVGNIDGLAYQNVLLPAFSATSAEFLQLGYETIEYRDGDGTGRIEAPEYPIILHPVVFGPEALPLMLPRHEKETGPVFKQRLVQDLGVFIRSYIGEQRFPLSVVAARPMNKALLLHRDFVNMVAVPDPQNALGALTNEQMAALMQILMVNLGAFCHGLISYDPATDKILGITYGTLEGGVPRAGDWKEFARRMIIHATAEPAQFKDSVVEGLPITFEKWTQSTAVKSIQEIGRFSAEYDLLDPPDNIGSLTPDEKYARLAKKIWGKSGLAGGAFMAWYGDTFQIPGQPWSGGLVVTATGGEGVDKRDIKPHEIVFIIPHPAEDTIQRAKINDIETMGASVEGAEFAVPLHKITTQYGAIQIGDKLAPPIAAIAHFHRHGQIEKGGNDIMEIPIDIDRYPPIPCGSVPMGKVSRYAMQYIMKERERGNMASMAVLGVLNHGSHVYMLTTPETLQDPFGPLKRHVINGTLRFTRNIPQL
jgi:hypothetical protein